MATPTSLPATFVAGNVLTAAQMNDLRGAFRVLQVVAATNSTNTTSASSTYADTGLTATITPSSTSSKILIMAHQAGVYKVTGDTSCLLRLLRGSTEISKFATGGATGSGATNVVGTQSVAYLDSPATTSATTYKTQLASEANVTTVGVNNGSTMSTIVLLEISA